MGDRGRQIVEGHGPGGPGQTPQIEARGQIAGSQDFTKATTGAVPLHRRTGRAADGKGHPRTIQLGISNHDAPHRSTANTCSLPTQAGELVSTAETLDQADSRLRPFKRRAFRTARPARVDMRARKPCLTDRRFLFG